MIGETLTSRLSFFGRVSDELTREPLASGEYRVSLTGAAAREAIYKDDGFFVFADVAPSSAAYGFRLRGARYQDRSFQQALPGAGAVELAFDGEDEVYVVATAVNTTARQLTFDAISFLPLIRKGAAVLGENGAATTLAEDCGGASTSVAVLTSTTGFAANSLVRIVRSRSLRAKPGPSYPFPAGTTLLALAIVTDDGTARPVTGARVRLTSVNGQAPATTTIGGVPLRHVSIGGTRIVLGTTADLEAFTDERGRAIFHFPGGVALGLLAVEISQPGFATATAAFTVAPAQRTSATVPLTAN